MATTTQSKNPHLTDPILQAFTAPDFSPIDYLNSTLPSLAPSATSSLSKPQQPSLSAIASQSQSHISTLNAQTARLSATLTALTDDILRTSSRLAYEVELLRGEALLLGDSLSSRGDLHEHILHFVPKGLDKSPAVSQSQSSSPSTARPKIQNPPSPPAEVQQNAVVLTAEPSALPHLRTLLHVRTQLQTVIQRFNLALSFPLPPSLLTTTTSSLISVAPPNADSEAESKGQAALSRLKQEIVDMLERGEIENAQKRGAELRDVCVIWKGTAEEKARAKWVDGLEVLIEDDIKKREQGRRKKIGENRDTPSVTRDSSAIRGLVDADTGRSGTPTGFLRRLRDEIYME